MRCWLKSRIRRWVELRIIDRLVGCVLPRIEDTEDVVSVHARWIRDLQARTASQASLIKAYREEKDALVFRVAKLEREVRQAERRLTKLERTVTRVSNAQADRIEAIESRLEYLGDLIASRTDAMAAPSRN